MEVHEKQQPNHQNCKWCKKTFNRPSQHKRHETTQLCRSKSERTYCKVCDTTYSNRKTYEKHLISRTHMSNLMKEDDRQAQNIIAKSGIDVNTRIVVHDPMYMIDPLLTKEEGEAISMGRDPSAKSMTIYMKDTPENKHNKDHMITMGVKNMEKAPIKTSSETMTTQYESIRESEKTPEEKEIERHQQQTTDYSKILADMNSTPSPTDRQRRILEYLGKWQDQPVQTMLDKFKPVLAALKLSDANYLRRHILEAPENVLSLSGKQVYAGYLDKFVEHIISLSVDGARTHLSADVPFDKLVINLCR